MSARPLVNLNSRGIPKETPQNIGVNRFRGIEGGILTRAFARMLFPTWQAMDAFPTRQQTDAALDDLEKNILHFINSEVQGLWRFVGVVSESEPNRSAGHQDSLYRNGTLWYVNDTSSGMPEWGNGDSQGWRCFVIQDGVWSNTADMLYNVYTGAMGQPIPNIKEQIWDIWANKNDKDDAGNVRAWYRFNFSWNLLNAYINITDFYKKDEINFRLDGKMDKINPSEHHGEDILLGFNSEGNPMSSNIQIDELYSHLRESNDIHVSKEEKELWNSKLGKVEEEQNPESVRGTPIVQTGNNVKISWRSDKKSVDSAPASDQSFVSTQVIKDMDVELKNSISVQANAVKNLDAVVTALANQIKDLGGSGNVLDVPISFVVTSSGISWEGQTVEITNIIPPSGVTIGVNTPAIAATILTIPPFVSAQQTNGVFVIREIVRNTTTNRLTLRIFGRYLSGTAGATQITSTARVLFV